MKQAAKKPVRRQVPSVVPFELPSLLETKGLLRELVIGSGLQVLAAMLEEDRGQLCGERYSRSTDRSAYRFGHADGELALGGRRVRIDRPRVRSKQGHELQLPTWQHLAKEDPLDDRATEQMLIGVTTRKYRRSLEPLPEQVEERGTSKSAVSRRFVSRTKAQLSKWMKRDLSALALCVLMIDAIVLDEHAVLVAIGIDESGHKQVLGVHEGATENATACTALLTDLRERKLDLERPLLVVIDGAKALRKAVREVLGPQAVVQRCQIHKMRNVTEHLPERERKRVAARMRAAYQCAEAQRAKRLLKGLAKQLEMEHPSAAASLREGLEETLTVVELGLSGALLRTLSNTNVIENLNGLIRVRVRNVKRWRGGSMIVRWVVAAVNDAARGFRRVRGHAQIPALLAALRKRTQPNGAVAQLDEVA
jgi:transposase-like protein